MQNEEMKSVSLDRAAIDERHMVARYVADRLSDEERRAFEIYMFANPEIVEDLEATIKLKVGLGRLVENGELGLLLSTKGRYRRVGLWAIAASIAVLAIGVLFWIGRGPIESRLLAASLADFSDVSLAVASTHSILRTRGARTDAEISLPVSRAAIELRVLPEFEASPGRYRVSLVRIEDDQSMVASGNLAGLRAGDDGFVVFYVNSSTFRSGRYQLSIGGDSETDAANSVSVFRIRFTPAGSPNKQQQ